MRRDPIDRLATRTFTPGDQRWFADATGDHNPMHVDPVAARRAMFGDVVVHGVHLVVWALDVWCRATGRVPGRLAVSFTRPVFVGEEVRLVVEAENESSSRVCVQVNEVTVTSINIAHDAAPSTRCAPIGTPPSALSSAEVAQGAPRGSSPVPEPADLDLDQMAGRTGTVVTPAGDDAWREAFPALGAAIGGGAIAELAALSTIVGMEVPGRHSVFGSFDVGLEPTARGRGGVTYEVGQVRASLSAVKMTVHGDRVAGWVAAFVRPKPTRQPSASEIGASVTTGEFAGVRAVVVGGSRGVGEVTAKLVAAGGGHAVITWRQGEDDARAVADDIRRAGGSAEIVHLDTAAPALPAEIVGGSTLLFYFATPRITARRLETFEQPVFERFIEAYVHGFRRVATAAVDAGASPLVIFYPSSVLVDEGGPEVVEYAAAKAAGEVAARSWCSNRRGTSLVIRRLPRMVTDQTASRTSVDTADVADTVATMCDVIREMVRSR